MPEPPGGMKAFYEYIYQNVKYPAMARENNIEGTVYLQFVVEPGRSSSKISEEMETGKTKRNSRAGLF